MELVGVKAEETGDRVRRRPVNHLREPLKVNIKVLKPNLLLKLSYFSRVSCQTAAVVKPGGVVSLTTVKDKCSSSNKPQRDSQVVPIVVNVVRRVCTLPGTMLSAKRVTQHRYLEGSLVLLEF